MLTNRLLSAVLYIPVYSCNVLEGVINYNTDDPKTNFEPETYYLNYYEFVYLHLREWADANKDYGTIDWTDKPSNIVLKAYDILNKQERN